MSMRRTVLVLLLVVLASFATPSLTFADTFVYDFTASVIVATGQSNIQLAQHGFASNLTTITGTLWLDIHDPNVGSSATDYLQLNMNGTPYTGSGIAGIFNDNDTSTLHVSSIPSDGSPFRTFLFIYPVLNVSTVNHNDCPGPGNLGSCIFPSPILLGREGVLELRSSGAGSIDPVDWYNGQTYYLNANITSITAVPEPSAFVLLASGLVGITVTKKRG